MATVTTSTAIAAARTWFGVKVAVAPASIIGVRWLVIQPADCRTFFYRIF